MFLLWAIVGFVGAALIIMKVWETNANDSDEVSLTLFKFVVLAALPIGGFGTGILAALMYAGLVPLTFFGNK